MMRTLGIVVIACLLLVSMVVLVPLGLLLLSAGSAAAGTAGCGVASAGPVQGDVAGGPALPAETIGSLTQTQQSHAATIVAVGGQLQVPLFGQVVALATAAQESKFMVYANDGYGDDLLPPQRGVNRSMALPHEAVGTDHGSVGIFQQQYPWWGSLEQLMDPAGSATLFYEALLRVPGWEQMSLTQAAQAVQRSAYPSAYAKWEPLARQLLAATSGAGAPAPDAMGAAMCGPGSAMTCPATPTAAERGLTPDALRVLRCVEQTFAARAPLTYGGVGERPDNPNSDHPAGRAVDEMIPGWDTSEGNALGWDIARWVQAHAAALGVTYVIFDDQNWSVTDESLDWGAYSHPSGGSDPTLDHLDHVHVSVTGNSAGTASGGIWTSPLAPGSYSLTSGYGYREDPLGEGRRLHSGLDFAAPTGTPVLAATAGTISHAGPSGGYGTLVILVGNGGVETYYAHLSSTVVDVGAAVSAGTMIGAVGTTGRSTGPHLHFEVRVDGAAVDPRAFLTDRAVTL